SSLAAQLTNDGKKAIQGKVQKGEQQAGETRCTANSGASHDAGEHSNSVTVTTLVTCVAEVFNRDDAMVMAANLLKSDAVQTFHTSYAQAGQVSTTLINAAVQNSQGTISLHIEAQGLWVAQFDAARQQQLARLITGLNIPSAQDLLTHQVGIAQASITVADSPGNVLPLDPRKITIRVA
ncbi:MAG: hypothetical protein J2P37_16570, partial [Ktedonobacteraceae bacterium]|nr:hypothetical protein [Ktedonobacteraceae bacterium]